jgi:acetyl-CoA C-acetyltransferase
MPMSDPVVIVSAARTPIGGLLGDLSGLTAPELGSAVIHEVFERAAVRPVDADEVIMGCVLPAGLGQAPARQASLGAGVPSSTGAITINKMCGSGLKAAMLAHDQILAGSSKIVVAGGMESMSNAPYLIPKMRTGIKMGNAVLLDHMMLDGLEDAYDKGQAMGVFAERCAGHYKFTREEQDAFALESLRRAQTADFSAEIVSLTVKAGKEAKTISADELPQKARPEKIPTLKPAFVKDGTVTAANASSISDGAAALLMMRRSEAAARKLPIIATIIGHATHAQDAAKFATAPIGALQRLAVKTGWALKDVDLFEINEAFAVVPMAAMRDLDLPHDRVNVHGGACALGHPIGASGARVLVTLLNALKQRNLKRGIATLCIGGGEAVAMAVETE